MSKVCNTCRTQRVCKYSFQNHCLEWKPNMDQLNVASMVRDLFRVDSGLTEWEIEFLDNVGQNQDFSDKQATTITQIYRRVCK